ncbi:MAG: ribonuclease HII [Firmicutes bacterium]|nr:ribonuclease HII [Bacillota bacterium]
MALSARDLRAARYRAAFEFDQAVREESRKTIGGVDEAGRGPLAGPVVAAAVVLPNDLRDAQYYDSKQLGSRAREAAYDSICENAIAYGVGIVDPLYIDRYNILQATYEAMRQAISGLEVSPEMFLVDGAVIPSLSVQQRKVIKGDALSQSIAAASILAKVTRDRLMVQAAELFPEYGFERHMGYGTPEHLAALQVHGPCALHRFSFAPVRAVGNRPQMSTLPDPRQRLGFDAEQWVVSYLVQRGWVLRERRFRVAQGEIDAIMEDGDTLVFLEVRARSAHAQAAGDRSSETAVDALLVAAESVDGRKRARLRKLAEIYLKREHIQQDVAVRFDVVAVAWDRQGQMPLMEHYRAAF